MVPGVTPVIIIPEFNWISSIPNLSFSVVEEPTVWINIELTIVRIVVWVIIKDSIAININWIDGTFALP